ncbi:nucleotidyltransferase domain-containing protein [Verrucomicrobiaceae bacterium N1E253]|uniref:Nucleotidyltransferase domain-containing protein n=1 Tax=Oceaniferula marina TaxID=2748318 RepID=A0A851GJ68_9BACT|nr:nucleotidyltransferase domain-containing protein [Oceaniferula marina]NWK55157.1 nucleotidyltransferase domain-containing protein [Oceaniferula marina]
MTPEPPTNEIAEQIAASVESVLHGEPEIKLVILYGSVARGKMRCNSDVDLAVLFDHPLSAEEKMKLVEKLAETLGKEVDLVDLHSLNGTILRKILCEGRVIYRDGSGSLARLLQRMIYNQTDMMPYTLRTLKERQRTFIHG